MWVQFVCRSNRKPLFFSNPIQMETIDTSLSRIFAAAAACKLHYKRNGIARKRIFEQYREIVFQVVKEGRENVLK